uniref:Uncharacterized protein n=1 Tax=Arundo donax TaxID=35708 RepID=A0A0A9BS63_ARUDO
MMLFILLVLLLLVSYNRTGIHDPCCTHSTVLPLVS